MLSSLATKLGLRRWTGGPKWRQLLRSRGMDPLALRALSSSRDLGDAWLRCARVDWVVELAVRAPAPASTVDAGLAQVLELADGWPGAAAVQRTREALRGADLVSGETLEALGAGLLSLVDGAPEVRDAREACEEAERWKQRKRIALEADRYDAAHAAAHVELADAFRRSVPLDVLRRALGDEPRHPYR